PTRLVSPDEVLKRRRANSFELATLLASFLIGNGFAACVVSGYATREVVNNDQQRVVCPFVPVEAEESTEEEQPEPPNKYQLRQPPDLRSQYLLNIEEEKVAKVQAEEANRLAAEQEERERLEQPPNDPKRGHRVHAWVAIVLNAPWCYKPGYRETALDPNTGEQVLQPPSAFFLEPSTGFWHEVSSPDYLAIESVWNQHNYYVNKQDPAVGLSAMRWDLAEGRDWEHFLPGEPYELREDSAVPEDQDPLTTDEEIEKEKHLDMPTSWVRSLNVSRTDYEQRFPDGTKVIYFKKTIYERFAPYRNLIGLVRRITTYDTLDYDDPISRWEFYANRDDQLNLVRIEYRTNETEERFDKGRPDCLRSLRHRAAPNNEYELRFFYQYRFDALRTLVYHAEYIQEHYDKRDDRLYYREFHNIPKDPVTKEPSKLTHIIEKFHQHPTKEPVKDIAIRNCYIQDNKIALQFHYGEDCITASTREFVKPPKSEMGEEVPYDPACTSGYVSNPWDPQPTQLDLFLLLKEQLKAEELASHAFRRRVVEIDTMLSERRKQTDSPRLTNSLFDPLRNEEARQQRLAKYEAIKAREEQIKQQQADFLAPYLLRLGNTSKRPPTRAQVMALYRDCTTDLRRFYQRLEEELRNRCDDLITEEQSLKRFLARFQQHFEDAEYEKFIAEGETIERDKHILQMRLENIQDDYRRKAAHLRQTLREDERLRPYFGAELEELPFFTISVLSASPPAAWSASAPLSFRRLSCSMKCVIKASTMAAWREKICISLVAAMPFSTAPNCRKMHGKHSGSFTLLGFAYSHENSSYFSPSSSVCEGWMDGNDWKRWPMGNGRPQQNSRYFRISFLVVAVVGTRLNCSNSRTSADDR
uniref:Dynein regulatory complex subunit 7 MORN domain-containing protein n=1 Tax=Anopheles melas TaxID=34690 RepID=A0A182U5I7_9DIPT